MQQENEQKACKQILLERLQKSVSITESNFERINSGSRQTQTCFRLSPLLKSLALPLE